MTEYRLNQAALSKARQLIDDGRYDSRTEWSDAAPSAAEGTDQIDRHGYDAYGEWHLGIDENASPETKGRYGFPYGDFSQVNRAALIHAKQRAVQNDHDEIAEAADQLLDRLDGRQSED